MSSGLIMFTHQCTIIMTSLWDYESILCLPGVLVDDNMLNSYKYFDTFSKKCSADGSSEPLTSLKM